MNIFCEIKRFNPENHDLERHKRLLKKQGRILCQEISYSGGSRPLVNLNRRIRLMHKKQWDYAKRVKADLLSNVHPDKKDMFRLRGTLAD